MIDLSNLEAWFVTGSQHLYGQDTLKTVEERLPVSKFFRVHRSYIVALNKIDTLQDAAVIINGKSQVILINDFFRYFYIT